MSLMLVPYHDAMRLGNGFNTFTQSLCMADAVTYSSARTVTTRARDAQMVGGISQTVTYSSRVVEKLSDIVETLNISYSAAIKRGTVEVMGSASTIDEDKIKSSDLNAVVSVKVQNQVIHSSESGEFKHLKDIKPNTPEFNEVYGDSYISGFIEGGEFTGVVSVRILDRAKSTINKITSQLKKSLGKGQSQQLTLDWFDINDSSAAAASSALKETETTVSVSWTGGGQVKNASDPWDIQTMFHAAAAFPTNVAACPQRTWAIVTKYTQNPSFIKWRLDNKIERFHPLEYENVNEYSAELFESYFQYKQLVKRIQNIINRPDNYEIYDPSKASKDPKEGENPPPPNLAKVGVPLDIATLVAVRSALRDEMARIVAAVDVLTKDPGALKRTKIQQKEPEHDFVRGVLARARGNKSTNPPSNATEPPKDVPQANRLTQPTPPANSTESGGSLSILLPPEQLTFDFSSLIAPEIWSEILPRRKQDGIAAANGEVDSSQPSTAQPVLPPIIPAPSEEEENRVAVGTYMSPQDLAQLKTERDDHKKELENHKKELAGWSSKYDSAVEARVPFYDGPALSAKLEESAKSHAIKHIQFRLSPLAGYPGQDSSKTVIFNSLDVINSRDRITRLSFHTVGDRLGRIVISYAGREDLVYGRPASNETVQEHHLLHNREPTADGDYPGYILISIGYNNRTESTNYPTFGDFNLLDSDLDTLRFLAFAESERKKKKTTVMMPPAPGWVVKGVWGSTQDGYICELGFVWGEVSPLYGSLEKISWDPQAQSVKTWKKNYNRAVVSKKATD